jgi:hypothetical protein
MLRRVDPPITIRVRDLRAVLDVVLARVEATIGGEIDLAADQYWDIDARAAFGSHAYRR